MSSFDFYKTLPVVHDFAKVTDEKSFHSLPSDWLVVISDVKGSTDAILRGKYKQINAVAVSMIVAVRNCYPDTELPFVFGGDGATICVPPGKETELRECLSSLVSKADALGLSLRVGIIPVEAVSYRKQGVKVLKFHVSEHYQQAFFSGGGIKFAEKLLKDPVLNRDYLIDKTNQKADFTGFECRWDSVKSRHGETVSLIIEADSFSTYSDTWQSIKQITGGFDSCHPITAEQLSFNWTPSALATEITIRSEGNKIADKTKGYFNIITMNAVGSWLMAKNVKTEHTDWGQYKSDFVANCDYIKFEDGLKLCISCSEAQRKNIDQYLAEQERMGNLRYGIHVTNAALITCMINDYQSKHIHFIDGENGGYSLAAVTLKEKRRQ